MNFINRSIKNVLRVKSKSILLMITFFILGNLVIVGLGISQAVGDAKTETRRKMRAVVEYKVDYDKWYADAEKIETEEERQEFYNNQPRIRLNDVKELVGSDGRIKAVNYLRNTSVYPLDGLQPLIPENPNDTGSWYYDESGNRVEYTRPSILIRGNSFPNYIEFEEGKYVMTSGRMYSQEDIDNNANVVVIEEGLAALNGLSVGDTIKIAMEDPNNFGRWYDAGDALTPEMNELELEIIGIYNNVVEYDPSNQEYQWNPQYIPDNGILVPSSTLVSKTVEIQKIMFERGKELYPDQEYYQDPENAPKEEDYYWGSLIILLNDPLHVEEFIEENQSKVGAYMVFDGDLKTFKELSRPLDAMARFSDALVAIIVINALVIITLITALTLKNREYEIGVLLAIGVSKVKVIGQLFVELLAIGLIGFTLAVGSGMLVTNVVGKWMLDAQLSTELEVEEGPNWGTWIGDEDYFTEVTQEELLSEYNASVKPSIIAMIYAGGIAVIFVSVLIPGLMVMRYNPKQILTNVR